MAKETVRYKVESFVDRWVTRWGFLVAVGGTGAVTARFAAITHWMRPWGPIGWWIAFLAGCAIAVGIFSGFAWAYGRWMGDRELRKIVQRSGINPLNDSFYKETIKLSDFYNRDYVVHEAKSFRDCYLTGPAVLFLDGGTITGVTFRHVQIVVLGQEIGTIWNVVPFKNCLISGGVMASLTLAMPRLQYDGLPEDMKKHVPVIAGAK